MLIPLFVLVLLVSFTRGDFSWFFFSFFYLFLLVVLVYCCKQRKYMSIYRLIKYSLNIQ